MLGIIERLRYGKRPAATSVSDEISALPPVPTGPIPPGDPIGAQGDAESGRQTAAHRAKQARS